MRRAIGTIAIAVLVGGCGGSAGGGATTSTPATGSTTGAGKVSGKLPRGAVGPVDTADQAAAGPAATEASPGEPPRGPVASGSLPAPDSAAVQSAVAGYIRALDRHDATEVCDLLAPGSLPLAQMPRPGRGCRGTLHASIGVRPRDGGPAWRKTNLVALKTERLGPDRARVSATVTHSFADRRYVSVEDDVIYLERRGERWLLAQPSGTLYRAVGYSQPPLRAFAPPTGW